MTARVSRTGRRGIPPAAGAVRALAGDPIVRRILLVWLLAIPAVAGVVAAFPEPYGVLDTRWLGGPWLLPGLTALTCIGEMVVVRLRHGDAEEELSLCEAAIIVDVLLLPPLEAVIAAVVGLAVASLILRRNQFKSLFNLGTYTLATSGMVAVVHLAWGTPRDVTVGVVLGVIGGTILFTAINLCCLAQVLGVVRSVSPWQIIRAEARLSAYMATGTVATGLPTAVVGLTAPILLPFMAMPALAVTYAYRAAAQEADERSRSATLLKLSRALAGREDVLRRFLVLVREAFGVDYAGVVLTGPDVAFSVKRTTPEEVGAGPVPDHLAHLVHVEHAELRTEGLPAGYGQMLVVPVAAGGRHYGIAVLAMRRRRTRLSASQLTMLVPLGNALAAAMREAERHDQLLAETSKLQAIADQSTEGILMVDGAGVVQMWSRALVDLTGVAGEDASGRRLADLLDLPNPDEEALLEPVSTGRPKAAVELTIRRPDGETRRLRLAHSAVFTEGALVRDVVVVSDLTREYRTERLKSDFIATVSHELRTPLTPIIGYVDLLRSRGERMTPQKRRDSLDVIADRATHMLRLVEDLLLASRISDTDGDPTMHVTPGVFDLAEIVRQVIADLDTPRIRMDLPDGPVPTHCDEARTRQVVSNLVGNALKYSPATEEVAVAMRLTGAQVEVVVTDHGRGIPADQLVKVFEKFHRVEDPMTMSTSGTGLGLFVARRLAQAMGGDIGVTSTLNVGSVFTLTLSPADAKDGSVSADEDRGVPRTYEPAAQ